MTLLKEIHQKPIEYLLLFSVFIVACLIFVIFRFDSHVQRLVVYGTSGIYFLWSLYHHYRRGDLHLSIIIEYLLFVVLAIVITNSILF